MKFEIGLIVTIGVIIVGILIATAIDPIGENYRIAELSEIVERDVEFCEGKSTENCNEHMLFWLEKCQESEFERVPNCNDGKIINYLKINGLLERNDTESQA